MKKTIIITITTIILVVIIKSYINMEEKPKYSWSPAVAALEEYPMEVYSGHLIIGKTLKGAYGYLSFNTTIENGLDQFTYDIQEMYYPPRFLDVSWYSFTEKKTYTGIFELNYELIDSLLKKDYIDFAGFDEEDKKLQFNTGANSGLIKVGLLPGGVVRLWVHTNRDRFEVGRYQAQEDKTIDWKIAHPNMKSMDERADRFNRSLPQEIKDQMAQNRIPFGSWERLFNRYNTNIKTDVTDKIEVMSIWYANAEYEEFLYIAGEKDTTKKRGIPIKINLTWRRDDGMRIEANVVFDQEKMLALFKDIKTTDNLKINLKVDKTADLLVLGKGLLLTLENQDKIIDLKPYIKEQQMYNCYTQFPANAPHKTVVLEVRE